MTYREALIEARAALQRAIELGYGDQQLSEMAAALDRHVEIAKGMAR